MSKEIPTGWHGQVQEWRLYVLLDEVASELSLKGELNRGHTIWAQGKAYREEIVCTAWKLLTFFDRGGENS